MHLVGLVTAVYEVVAGSGAHQVQPAAGLDQVVSAGSGQHVVERAADHASDVEQPVAALARRSAQRQVDPNRSCRRLEADTGRPRGLAAYGDGSDPVVAGTWNDGGLAVSGEENCVVAGAAADGPDAAAAVPADVVDYVVSWSEVDADVLLDENPVIPTARAHYVLLVKATDHVVATKADNHVVSIGAADPVVQPGAEDGRLHTEAAGLGATRPVCGSLGEGTPFPVAGLDPGVELEVNRDVDASVDGVADSGVEPPGLHATTDTEHIAAASQRLIAAPSFG